MSRRERENGACDEHGLPIATMDGYSRGELNAIDKEENEDV